MFPFDTFCVSYKRFDVVAVSAVMTSILYLLREILFRNLQCTIYAFFVTIKPIIFVSE